MPASAAPLDYRALGGTGPQPVCAAHLMPCSLHASSHPSPAESAGNSRSSTQMNSYSDSGFQEACGYYGGQGAGKQELRLQHSYPGSGNSLGRGARAEGQTSIQVRGLSPRGVYLSVTLDYDWFEM